MTQRRKSTSLELYSSICMMRRIRLSWWMRVQSDTGQVPLFVIIDGLLTYQAVNEVRALIQKTGLPVFVTPMGKGAIDETIPNYGGVYAGDGSNPGVRERVESSDLILSIGAIKSDFNTAGFTYRISQLSTIDFHSYGIKVRYSEYPGVRMNGVLRKVTDRLDKSKLSISKAPEPPTNTVSKEVAQESADIITQEWFWPKLGAWLREDDIVITETGTANFGIWETRFPEGAQAISQVLWGSIGYATGSCQGAALAAKEKGIKRTILFTGDGSFQLTAQEVSTMLRNKLNPIIFIICNDGYTIERYIHGMDADYNDVQPWRYKQLPEAFGAEEGQAKTYIAKTRKDVEELFADKEFAESEALRFVELYIPKKDAPTSLKLVAEASAKNNAKLE